MSALALAGPPTSDAIAPRDPRCLDLVAGSTGLLAVGGDIPSPDQLAGARGGFGPVATRELPRDVVVKTARETFSNEYAFALRDGRIHVRAAKAGRAVAGEAWHVLELPACLDGRISQISADHRLLLALDEHRQVYAHDMPGGDLSAERWTWRWGPYFWTGTGARMPADVTSWATSEFTSAETFTDSSGRRQHPIGVATVYLLREGGRRITYLDPWLPADESREVCGPRRGTVPLASLSASGSTVFAVSRRGELFTRLYDFDIAGANTVFGSFSWQQDRPADDRRWQLPGPGWVRHRRPPGALTDRITIAKSGSDASDRVLRIEGRTPRGRRGVWEKPLTARTWSFTATGEPLAGTVLPRGRTPQRPGAADGIRFSSPLGEVLGFHQHCSPATLRVRVAPDLALDLVLHTSDGLRQETRSRDLDDIPREYNGAIEVPAGASADPRARAWIAEHLGGRRITTAPVAVTRTRLRFLDQCWELTRDGAPARPDQLRIPPDLGAVLGRVTERQADGRPLPAC